MERADGVSVGAVAELEAIVGGVVDQVALGGVEAVGGVAELHDFRRAQGAVVESGVVDREEGCRKYLPQARRANRTQAAMALPRKDG